jgi:hypothetical protein
MSGQALYQPLAINEFVPESLKIGSLSSASVIQDRKKVRTVPQGSGGKITESTTQLNWILADSGSYLDPMSAFIVGKLKIKNPKAGFQNLTLDEGFLSLIHRARLYMGGVLVEDRNYANISVLHELYANMSDETYRGQGLLAGLNKFNPQFFADCGWTVPGTPNAPPADWNASVSGSTSNAGVTWGNKVEGQLQSIVNGYTTSIRSVASKANSFYRTPAVETYQSGDICYFALPLCWLFGAMRSTKSLPLRNIGQIQITLDIENINTAFFVNNNGSTEQVGSYEIEGLEMLWDAVTPSPLYSQVLDSLCADPSLPGWVLPIKNVSAVSANYSGNGQKQIALNVGKKNLRSMLFSSQDQANQNNLLARSASQMACNDFKEFYIQCGSHRFPNDPATGYHKAYLNLMDSQHGLNAAMYCPLVSYDMFCGINNTAGRDNTGITSEQCFLLGISFERNRGEGVDIDGIDSTASGSQIVINLNNNPANPQVLVATIESTQILTVQGNRVTVV